MAVDQVIGQRCSFEGGSQRVVKRKARRRALGGHAVSKLGAINEKEIELLRERVKGVGKRLWR
jgi:hypothetical protein